MAGLDESNLNPAYLAGRVFSVAESIQRAAYPGDDRPNVTFFNRYFSGAVTNPAIALVQGTQLSAAWLKKLEGRPSREGAQKDRKSRAAHALRGRLTNLYDRFDATGGLPRGMGIDDQTAFILGYFHQNAHDQQARAAGRARAGDAEAELTEPELDLTDTEQP
jgi:CRISPR-associated protein Csd1